MLAIAQLVQYFAAMSRLRQFMRALGLQPVVSIQSQPQYYHDQFAGYPRIMTLYQIAPLRQWIAGIFYSKV